VSKVERVGTRIRFTIERLDGGLNTKDAPSKIEEQESPDCLNVVFDDSGSAETRPGSEKFNTQLIGSHKIDGLASYNGTMVAWAGGSMYRASGTTFVTVPSAQGKYASGAKVASVVYQGILFSSDGTNGPWKYENESSFYNMGIDTPSATTGSGTSAGSIQAGTYYYTVSFVNSQAVEGQVGSVSAGVTIAVTSTIGLTDIPVGSSLAGVNNRRVYRSTNVSGPFRRIGSITDNTTTTFADTVAPGAEGVDAIEDGTKPTPFTTITLHKERLFFDDSSNRSLLRYTNFENPFVSEVENFEPLNNRDGETIICVVSHDDIVTAFKDNDNYQILTEDPTDAATWSVINNPSNLGIVGARAFALSENGCLFIGRQNNKLTGLHFLSGLIVDNTSDTKLRTKNLSEKVEPDLIALPRTYWPDIAMELFENRLYIACTTGTDTFNKHIYWLDLNRLGTKGQPGSWSKWTGIESSQFISHSGNFYAGTSNITGFVHKLLTTTYNDAGAAINSYWFSKQLGGDELDLESFKKDFRELYVWHEKLGDYNMNVRYRIDGDLGAGDVFTINLNPLPSVWGTMIWGVGIWSANVDDKEERFRVGRTKGHRIQLRFDNQNTVNQGFKVHQFKIGMNVRGPV